MDMTPETLFKELKKTVIGQDRYVKDLCTAAWLHSLRYSHFMRTGEVIGKPKQNLLCLGPSGSGKTLAVQAIGKILDLPVLIQDASALRGAGWKGQNVSSIIARAIDVAKDDAEAEFSIVCLDEIDKVFRSRVEETAFLPLDNLLTFLCGGVITHTENGRSSVSLDTSNMLVICLGAFPGLDEIIEKRLLGGSSIGFFAQQEGPPAKDVLQSMTEQDLHAYGIPWEFLGRISLITRTEALTDRDYRQILAESEASPVKQFDRLLYPSFGVHISISDAAIAHIAKASQDSKSGARLSARIVTQALQPAIYNLASNQNVSEIILDFGDAGLFARQILGSRPDRQGQGSGGDSHLGGIEQDILDSVPFFCEPKRGDIWLYAEAMKRASVRATMFPPECASAAVCILAAATAECSAFSGPIRFMEGNGTTMLQLNKALDALSPGHIRRGLPPAARQVQEEFIAKASRYTPDFGTAKRMAKRMLLDYCRAYIERMGQPDG